MGQFRPIRGQYPGQVISIDQSEASIQGHGGPIHSIIAPGAGSCHYPDDGHTPAIRMVTPRHQNGHSLPSEWSLLAIRMVTIISWSTRAGFMTSLD